MIDDVSESVSNSYVINRLFVSTVARSLKGTQFECRAYSIQTAAPVSRSADVEVYCESLMQLSTQ